MFSACIVQTTSWSIENRFNNLTASYNAITLQSTKMKTKKHCKSTSHINIQKTFYYIYQSFCNSLNNNNKL